MAELLSVQVHAPVTLTSVNATSAGAAAAVDTVDHHHLKTQAGDCGTASAARGRLKKVDNADVTAAAAGGPAAGTTFDFLPRRRTVNIEFDQLTYSVSEGRKKGDHHLQCFIIGAGSWSSSCVNGLIQMKFGTYA